VQRWELNTFPPYKYISGIYAAGGGNENKMEMNSSLTKLELIKHIRNFCLDCTDDVRGCSGSTYNGDPCVFHNYRLLSYRKKDVVMPEKSALQAAVKEMCCYCLQDNRFNKMTDCHAVACYLKKEKVIL
jgi:hypothetical protein